MRVVSLTCSNTEIVHELGCSELLVGVDDHSDWPAEVVGKLPRVGPDLDVDPEKVAALRPDLVLASLTVPGHERVVERLHQARLPVEVTAPVSIPDVYEDVLRISELLGVRQRGDAVVKAMRAELDRRDTPARRPRVLVEWWPKPVIVPGRDSWVNQLLDAAGAVNPMADRAVKSSPITDEEALALRPDVVVISWCGVRFEKYRTDIVYRRERWRDLPALANRRVYRVAEAYLGRPGPRLVEGCRAFRRIVEDYCGSPG